MRVSEKQPSEKWVFTWVTEKKKLLQSARVKVLNSELRAAVQPSLLHGSYHIYIIPRKTTNTHCIPATHLHPHRWRWRWLWWSPRRHPRRRRPHRMPAQTPACCRSRRWWKCGHMPCLKIKTGKKRVMDLERRKETEESYKCVLILSSWT